MKKEHPEQLPGELYMGNASASVFHRSSWRTSRLGEVAYDIYGKVIPRRGVVARFSILSDFDFGDLQPWFIQRREVKAAIITAQLEGKPWSGDRIRVYRNMLLTKLEQYSVAYRSRGPKTRKQCRHRFRQHQRNPLNEIHRPIITRKNFRRVPAIQPATY